MAVARAMPVLYPLRATPYFEIEEIRRRATMYFIRKDSVSATMLVKWSAAEHSDSIVS